VNVARHDHIDVDDEHHHDNANNNDDNDNESSSEDDDDAHESKRRRKDKESSRRRNKEHRSSHRSHHRERKHKHKDSSDGRSESATHKQTRLEREFANEERRPIASLIPEMSSRASVLVAASDKWPDVAYFIDGRPDPDNVRFGHPYRMHVPVHRLNARVARGLPPALFLRANDGAYKLVDSLDSNVAKAPARYFGNKHVAVSLDRANKRVIRGATGSAEALRAPLPLVAFVPLATTNSLTTAMTPAGAADEAEGETLQEHMFRRARQFNERLRITPHDVALWLEFAAFQEPFLRAQSDRVDGGAIDDKRIAVLEAALRENADSDEVQLAYLEACSRRWDQSALERQWRTLLASNASNARLWLGYIAFRSSYFGTFSVGALRAVYAEAVASLMKARYGERDELIVRHLETAVLSIVVKYAVFERQAGYTERAVGCLQALLEFNLFAPADVPQHRRLAAFGRFWESEAPRVGDVGARGWRNSSAFDAAAAATAAAAARAADPRASSPPPPPPPDDVVLGPALDAELARTVRVRREAQQWCQRELQSDARLWQPIRMSIEPVADEADEAETDVERAVLFDDIRPFVVELSLPALHYELLCQLGSFFGFEAAPRRPTSHPLVRDRDDERESLAGVLDRVATADDDEQLAALYSDHCWRDEPRAPQNPLAREFVRRAFELAAQMWHEAAGKRRTTAAALTTVMLHLRSAPSIELGSLESVATATRASGEHHRASMAAQQLLRLASARTSAHDRALDAGALKAVRRSAKALLSERRDDLALWRAYAAAEHNNDNFDEARRILMTALASVELRGSSADAPAFALVQTYVENELFQWRAPTDLSEHVRMARAASALELLPLSASHRRAGLAIAALANGQRYDESNAPPLVELFGATRIVRMRAALRQRVAEADSAVAEVDSALRIVAQLRQALGGRAAADAMAACGDVQDDVTAEGERRRDAQLSIHVIAAAFEFVLGAAGGPTAARLALGGALGTLDARSWRREALVCAWLRLEQLHAAVRREPPSHAAHVLQCALQDYPSNATLLAALIGSSGARARLGSGVRRYFDARCRPRTAGGAVATPLEWIMAIAAERKRAASGSRVRALFEKALGGQDWRHAAARHSIVLWRFYVHYELATGDVRGALRVFFRAVRAVPWCKALWQELLATELVREASAAQVLEVEQLMDEKEVRLRVKPPPLSHNE
jgi:hypothetical protein